MLFSSCSFFTSPILFLLLSLLIISTSVNCRRISVIEKKQEPLTEPPFNVASPTAASPTAASPTAASTTVASTTVASTTVKPSTVASTTAKPTTVASTTVKPSTVASTTVKPSTVASTTAKPTTVSSTTIKPTTVASTTVKPSTVASTTVKPTTVASTTVKPSTVASTTAKPTTVASTTVKPSTVASTTIKPTTATPSLSILEEINNYVTKCNFTSIVDELPDNVSTINWTTIEISRSLANLIIQLGDIKSNTSCRPLKVWVDVISLAYYEVDCRKKNNFNVCRVADPAKGLPDINTLQACTKFFCAQNPGDYCRTASTAGVCNLTSSACPVSCVRLAGVDDASLDRAMARYALELSSLEEDAPSNEESDVFFDERKKNSWFSDLLATMKNQKKISSQSDNEEDDNEEDEELEDVFSDGNRMVKRGFIDSADTENDDDEDKRAHVQESSDYCYEGAPSCHDCSSLGVAGLACFDIDRFSDADAVFCCRCVNGYGGVGSSDDGSSGIPVNPDGLIFGTK